MVLPKRGRLVTNSSAAEECSIPSNSKTVQDSSLPLRRLTMSQHSDNLLAFLNEDRTRQRFCDVSVLVGGTVYRAHKAVLAHGSSYFHAELSKNSGTMTHVTLDHVEDSVFQHLLGFLYTSECVVAETDLPALADAARFLDMMDVLKLAFLCLLSSWLQTIIA
uniref:BTB domain-containing protein n=1 Tax=Xiphophorus maculatus TaxID=8083 RepID=A0A3B5Q9U6_XIPMA